MPQAAPSSRAADIHPEPFDAAWRRNRRRVVKAAESDYDRAHREFLRQLRKKVAKFEVDTDPDGCGGYYVYDERPFAGLDPDQVELARIDAEDEVHSTSLADRLEDDPEQEPRTTGILTSRLPCQTRSRARSKRSAGHRRPGSRRCASRGSPSSSDPDESDSPSDSPRGPSC